MKKNISSATHCIHTGTFIPEGDTGVNTPIFTSAAFSYEDGVVPKYPRAYNTVNQTAVAQKVAALEGGEEALVLSSGIAAISTAMLGLLKAGDHAVLQQNLYGGTHFFAATILERFGITYSYTEGNLREHFEKAIKPNTKFIYIETPSNPLLEVVDMEMVASVAKKHGVYTLIDNTFASPINQQPIHWGIDVVIHSATKYLGGHSDMCAGVIVSSKEIIKKCHLVAFNLGGCLEPMPCYLLERSIKTLAVRMERHNSNALAVAQFLSTHPSVTKVNYPGLPSHPDYAIAKKQMGGFGGMLSFEVKDGMARKVIERLEIIAKALSLGGVESTICEPAKTSHSKLTAEQRAEKGISDGLLRLSVGIEAVEDLISDLRQAL